MKTDLGEKGRLTRAVATLTLAAGLSGFGIDSGLGQTTSAMAGFNDIDCPGGADTLVSIPFQPNSLLRAALSAAPSVNGGQATLRFGSGAGLPGNGLAGTHYVRFGAGSPLEGRIYPVTGNDTMSVTVDRKGDTFVAVSAGAGVDVVPMWTLEALLPAASQQALHVSGGVLRPERKSELMVFNPEAEGENLVPARKFFVTADGWREAASGFPDASDAVIEPGSALVIRHGNGDGGTTLRVAGRVITGLWETRLRSLASGPQENPTGVPVAEDVALFELQLESVFDESSDTTPEARRDEILVFSGAGDQNPEPTAVYFRVEGIWRKDTPGFPVANTAVIPAGAGVVIRSPGNGGGNAKRWVFDTGF